MTYGEIYTEFCETTNLKDVVEDYRPCVEMYGAPNISNAIIVWLKGGSKIIYIANDKVIKV